MQDDQTSRSRRYYDEFSKRYDDKRGGRRPGGYHDLVDDLEVELVRRYGEGRDVLEVGCGTGLLLARFAEFARAAKGIDLSEGMLAKAKARGLDVQVASATELPFADDSFDVACSFKVLAHIPPIQQALSEMARVVRPGGHVLAEFYNPNSLRFVAKRLAGPLTVGEGVKESDVYTRFDAPSDVARLTPAGMELVGARGIRIVTPAAFVLDIPVLSGAISRIERALADTQAAKLAGFYVAVWRKRG
ncbi:MAG: class I SAM-dependent methyltransferase [Polyangiaceae bacterium]|nr:class I SAM-dependent methyltransferase [Polyangiaceae bacterium]